MGGTALMASTLNPHGVLSTMMMRLRSVRYMYVNNNTILATVSHTALTTTETRSHQTQQVQQSRRPTVVAGRSAAAVKNVGEDDLLFWTTLTVIAPSSSGVDIQGA